MNITEPLRLATGSHQAGTGKGCAMNVLSWENGDIIVTDLPSCSDPMLGRIVQRVNDTICTHTTDGLLCAPCSVKVLELAHRTVGTGGPADLVRRRVWVRVAADQAQQVVHLTGTARLHAEDAISAALAWADDPTAENAQAAAAATAAAYANADADAAYAADAATTAAAYAANADAAAIAIAAAYAATYATAAAYANAAYAATRLALAHRAADKFYEYSGLTEHATSPEVTVHAVKRMLVQQ